ncbi:MAG: nucleotide exchange factor GrpE [Candidatus Shapirobacteria bacterium]
MKSNNKDLKIRVTGLEEQLKRALADYRNLECRIEKEISHFKKNSALRLIDKLLGVLDDLERAESHLEDKGLAIAVNQFKEVLLSEGVKEIKSKGEMFDPELMDCVEMGEGKQNLVVKTLNKGYTLDGRVVRPAKVRVGQGGKK